MSVLIAHASISENGTVNGTKGDQTKKEVCIRTWYSKPWGSVIRFTDPNMAEKVASCMEMACANDNIGYSQNTRNTLLNESRKHKYDVSKVTIPVNADCSSLVSVACMYAGIPESMLVYNGNCATTRTLQNALKATGLVKIYTTPDYTAKNDKLKRGDILLKSGSHVVVVVKAISNPYKRSVKLIKRGMKNESVKWLQWELNRLGYKLIVDGDFGQKTYAAVIDFQQTHSYQGKKLVVDGLVGAATIGALENC